MAESSRYLDPAVLSSIHNLGLRAQRVVEGTISGLHRSPLHGVSVEFASYREYAPGMYAQDPLITRFGCPDPARSA